MRSGNNRSAVGGLEHRVRLGRERGELEDGVDGEVLYSRALVELAGRHDRERSLDGGRAAPVPIVDGVLEQPTLPVEQGEVDSPGVDTDRIDRPGLGACRAQPFEHFAEEAKDVPVEDAAGRDRNVRKSVHLARGQPLSVVAAQHDATALGAQVDRGHRRHQPSPLGPPDAAPDGRPAGHG